MKAHGIANISHYENDRQETPSSTQIRLGRKVGCGKMEYKYANKKESIHRKVWKNNSTCCTEKG